jgi:hypothetical protein
MQRSNDSQVAPATMNISVMHPDTDSRVADTSVDVFQSSFLPGPHHDRPWLENVHMWNSGIADDQIFETMDTEIDWFWQNQSLEMDLPFLSTLSPVIPPNLPLIQTYPQERDSNGLHPPPRYLQEGLSKVSVNHLENIDAPNCGFPICNALTQERRIELLMDLRNLTDVDVRDAIFSLNSMKQGVHLWSREISTEYNFLHRELLLLQDDNATRDAVLDVMGEPPGAPLIWSTITFGWALMRTQNDHALQTATRVQAALRACVFSVASLPW